jgi:hypothetical protein
VTAVGYSLHSNQNTREGPSHPDRDAQFRHITAQVRQFQTAGQPMISVDTEKRSWWAISRMRDARGATDISATDP